jgi:hypothetical protein
MIVGVAVKFGDYIEIRMPAPNRHCDCFSHFSEVTGLKAPPRDMKTGGDNQGFYTDKGIYLNRFQSMRHAKRCRQKLIQNKDCKHRWSDPLFSEDLW